MAHEAGRFLMYSEPHSPLSSRIIFTDSERASCRGGFICDVTFPPWFYSAWAMAADQRGLIMPMVKSPSRASRRSS